MTRPCQPSRTFTDRACDAKVAVTARCRARRRQRIAWIVWTFLLVASLAAVRALNHGDASRTAPGDERVPTRDSAFICRSRAKRRGVDFVHQAPTFDAQLAHIMPQVASMGAAVAVADFDRDGWQDFYVTNSGEGSLNRLYRNKGDGTFTDVAAQLGRGRRQPARHRRVDGRGLGRLRQRRLRRSVPLSLRPPGALSQRAGQALRRGRRASRAARRG